MRALFALSFLVLFAVAIWVVRVSVPTVPAPCETPPSYSTLPSIAAIGAVASFWLGGLVRHPSRSDGARGHERPKGTPVYLTLAAALFVTALLLGYEVYAVATASKPDITITHYVRCAYASIEPLVSAASVAGAWAVCLILGHWFAYRQKGS